MGDFKKWLNIAKRDLETAQILINHHKPAVENACYHCQQCAEKSLKAYLEFSGELIPFNHNLALLCKKCVQLQPEFQKITRQANQLNPFITITRYEECLDLTEADGKLAVKRAEEVLDFVKNMINSSETPPES